MDFKCENQTELIEKALQFLADHPEMITKVLESELSLPNIPLPTMGGKIFWITLAEHKGYRLQQNHVTKHARILDADNKRIAWGTINGMIKVLDRVSFLCSKYSSDN